MVVSENDQQSTNWIIEYNITVFELFKQKIKAVLHRFQLSKKDFIYQVYHWRISAYASSPHF
jgi:hypothetical protein